jgi:tetratricopeptide (TPR) repeat protein
MKKIHLVSALVFLIGIAKSQAPDNDIKFRLAESYERSGDVESAVRLYGELYKKDSANVILFEALRRDYMQLKRYDDAIALVSRAVQKSPLDIIQLAQLGSLYVLKSNEQKAQEIWDTAIAIDPAHEGTYNAVARSMIESRLFEQAITLYVRGRKACHDENLFTTDLAYLYSITLKYAEATSEYVHLVRLSPMQLPFAQSRIASYTARKEGLAAATITVEQAVKNESNNTAFQQLLAWLYMEAKDFDRAYEVYKIIDAKSNAAGHELYTFAERTLNEKGYASSAKAFQEIITRYPKFEFLPQTKFGYARTLEEATSSHDTLHPFGIMSNAENSHPEAELTGQYAAAITAYQQVINEFPKSDVAARSLLRTAILKQERLFDLDGARTTLEILVKDFQMFPQVVTEGRLRLGDVFLVLGNLAVAEQYYQSLTDHQIIVGRDRETASLRLAELDYFQGKFQEALTKLQQLSKNAALDITNDALKLQIFIQDNMQDGLPALKDFAKAELFKRQSKLSEAFSLFESITKTYPVSTLVDESLMNMGDLLTQMQRYADAVSSYQRLMKDFPESIVLDAALMKIGTTYQLGLHDKIKAIEAYQTLLEKYPNSIYVSEARKRIRELRGDTI